MIKDGDTCPSILLQLSAIQGALTKVRHILVRDYFDNCLAETFDRNVPEYLNDRLNELSEILIEATKG
jgi:DNA-binding FrmR family transcriptional regulator